MTEKNKKKRKLDRKKKLKIFFISIFLLGVTALGAVGGIVLGIAKDAPEINHQISTHCLHKLLLF